MDQNEVKITTIVCGTAIILALILWAGLYTKAQNDQAYYEIVGSHMTSEGFDQFMTQEQLKLNG